MLSWKFNNWVINREIWYHNTANEMFVEILLQTD